MSQKYRRNVTIRGQTFTANVTLNDKETADREGHILQGIEITFDPEDAHRLSGVMRGIKPEDFSIGFNGDTNVEVIGNGHDNPELLKEAA